MKTSLRQYLGLGKRLLTIGALLLSCLASTALAGEKAKLAQIRKDNPIVGVFTVRPLSEAMLEEDPVGLIESGAGFLFADGSAIGFDQILETPQASIAPEEVEAFLGQDGVLFLNTPHTFVFKRWQFLDDGTVGIGGVLHGGLFGLPDPIELEVALVGFIFSDDPVFRDLISDPDNAVDHLEYIETDPSKRMVAEVAEFLVLEGILSPGDAGKIRAFFNHARAKDKRS